MHICHVNLASGFSGGERQTINLIKELACQGVLQTLVAKKGSRLFDELKDVVNLEYRECSHFLLGHRGGNWDIIHCHDGKAVYWGFIESLLRKTPYIITRRVDNQLGSGFLTSSAYSRADVVVCLSRAIQNVVRERFDYLKTIVIPSSYSEFPADPQRVLQIRNQYQGKRLVGQAGRLLTHKGYQVTIEAARILYRSMPDLQFIFLGDGPDEAWLRSLAADLPCVNFLGHQDDVGNWLAALDIFVFPSLSEGLGSTILEAMQHGVPVIAAEAGGIPDIVHHKRTGLLVAPGSPYDLVRAIQLLLEDPGLSSNIVVGAKCMLGDFSPQATVRKYLELYSSIFES